MSTLDERALEFANSVAEYHHLYDETRDFMHSTYAFAAEIESLLHEDMEGTFGQAIESLKRGCKVSRKGWNGKGMFLWLKPAALVKSGWCKDALLKSLADANGGEIEALGTICMKTADGKILTGWLASQTDMLSNDWVLVS